MSYFLDPDLKTYVINLRIFSRSGHDNATTGPRAQLSWTSQEGGKLGTVSSTPCLIKASNQPLVWSVMTKF